VIILREPCRNSSLDRPKSSVERSAGHAIWNPLLANIEPQY
jgi:hypothetical protein